MWLETLAILGGIAVLVWGADRFVTGAAALARNLGVSALIIGLTVVGLGTSAPEILVSAIASLEGNTELAIGNAVGSNIANIGLILGATALLVPLTVQSGTLRREYPLVLAVSFLALALLWNQRLERLDGIILLACLVAITLWMIHIARQSADGSAGRSGPHASRRRPPLGAFAPWRLGVSFWAALRLRASASLRFSLCALCALCASVVRRAGGLGATGARTLARAEPAG